MPEPSEVGTDRQAGHRRRAVQEARHRLLRFPNQSDQEQPATHARVAARATARPPVPKTTKSAYTKALLTANQANDRLLHSASRVARRRCCQNSRNSRMRTRAAGQGAEQIDHVRHHVTSDLISAFATAVRTLRAARTFDAPASRAPASPLSPPFRDDVRVNGSAAWLDRRRARRLSLGSRLSLEQPALDQTAQNAGNRAGMQADDVRQFPGGQVGKRPTTRSTSRCGPVIPSRSPSASTSAAGRARRTRAAA